MNLPATQDSATPAVAQGPFDVLPSNFESYLKAAEIISKTDLVPKFGEISPWPWFATITTLRATTNSWRERAIA
jgi:hypothetical protein